MESLAPRLRGLLLLIMARVYIGVDLQGPPEKLSQKRKWRRGDEEYALANGRGLFGGIADARNGKGAESV
jgi:hypothetical protein